MSTQDLGLLLPGAQGVLQGQGTLAGPRDTPRIVASLDADKVRLQGYRLDSLHAAVDVDVADRQVSKIDIKGAGIEANGQSVEQRDAVRQRQAVRACHSIYAVTGQAAACRERDCKAGGTGLVRHACRNCGLEEPAAQTWALQQPASFTVARERGAVRDLCLVQADARICAAADWQPAGWTAAVDGKQLPLALLKPWLARGYRPGRCCQPAAARPLG